MHVIFGATGRVGGETAKALLAMGTPVRVVMRRSEEAGKWQAQGADVAIADMADPAAIARALDGASSALLLCPPPVSGDPYLAAETIGTALAAGARQAGLPKAVILSSIGAQHATGTGVIATLHQMEHLLGEVAPATALLRPGYFIETWSEVVDPVLQDGIMPTFIDSDLRIPMVSTADVGGTAAKLLCETWTGKRVVELGGPTDWSSREVADAFAKALNKPVIPLFVPEADRIGFYASAGVPPLVAEALLGMYEGIASGRIAREGDQDERRGTTTLETAIAKIVKAAVQQPS